MMLTIRGERERGVAVQSNLRHGCRPESNRILRSLCPADLARIQPHLSLVELTTGQTLYESAGPQRHAYFPVDAIIGMVYVMEDGHTGEFAIVGNDGLLGVSIFTGCDTMPSTAIVQNAGRAWRLRSDVLRREANQSERFRGLLLRYTQALMLQMCQTAACNRHHKLDQQLCRWILFCLDRLPDQHLDITQELIANMLGVRREGVTEAVGKLVRADLIRCKRGRIIVVDRAGLEAACCECYRTVRRETERLLPG